MRNATSRENEIPKARSAASFCDLLAAHAEESPGSPAVSWKVEGRLHTLDWYHYRERILDVACGYLALDIQPGEAIAMMASNRVEHLIADLAGLHCGAVSVSLYSSLATDQLAHILRDCQPRIIVVEGTQNLQRISTIAQNLASSPKIVFIPGPGDAQVPVEAYYNYWRDWTELESDGHARRETLGAVALRRAAQLRPEDPATYIYTSGTTGPSKGVILNHGNLVWEVEAIERCGIVDYAYRSVSYLPLAHIAERLWTIYLPLRLGGHVMCCPEAAQLVDCLRIHCPSYLMAVPRVWEKLQAGIEAFLQGLPPERSETARLGREALLNEFELRQAQTAVPLSVQVESYRVKELELRDVRKAFGLEKVLYASSAAAPLRSEVTRFFASIGLAVHQGYGLTETGGPILGERMGFTRLGSVGMAYPGVDIKLAKDGELLVRAPANTPGYRNLPVPTSELYTEDGFLRTGDIARIDEAGLVYLTDRKKEIIVNSSGKNIAPTNIESRVAGRSFISQAIAYGDDRPYVVALLTVDGPKLLAFAAARGIASVDLEHLVTHPDIVAEAQLLVDDANAFLSRPEQIKRFRLMPQEWSIDRSEVTPTFKLRRKIIHKNFAVAIEGLYAAAAELAAS